MAVTAPVVDPPTSWYLHVGVDGGYVQADSWNAVHSIPSGRGWRSQNGSLRSAKAVSSVSARMAVRPCAERQPGYSQFLEYVEGGLRDQPDSDKPGAAS